MNTMLTWIALLLALWLAACNSPAASAAGLAHDAATHYIVHARAAEGGFIEVGRLVARADGRIALTVTTSGAPAERLHKAWSDIDRRPSLSTKLRAADGSLVGRIVDRGSPEFAAALADVMSREYGYFVSEVPAAPRSR